MFGKLLQIINIIYIGIIVFVTITKVSADNLRRQTGLWSIDPQAIFVYNHQLNNHPRKLHWYTIRHPVLTARKQRMGNLHLNQRYKNVPYKIAASYGNPMRNTFRNYYEAPLTANTLKSFIPTVSLPTATATTTISIPKKALNTSFHQLNLFHEDLKKCAENNKNISLVSSESNDIITPHKYRSLERPLSSLKHNILPITDLPILPYVAHAHFTLDDVIIPSSSDNLYYKSDIKESIRHIKANDSVAQNSFHTPKSKISDILSDLFDSFPRNNNYQTEIKESITKEIIPDNVFTTQKPKFSDNLAYDPQEKLKDIVTTTVLPATSNFLNKKIVYPDLTEATKTLLRNQMILPIPLPGSTIVLKNETKVNNKNASYITLNRKLIDKENWAPKIDVTESENQTSTANNTINDLIKILPLEQTKLTESADNNATILKDNRSIKKPNVTLTNLLLAKSKIIHNHKKFSIKSTSIPHSTSSTTESAPYKYRRNTTSQVYLKRRKLNAKVNRIFTTHLNTSTSTTTTTTTTTKTTTTTSKPVSELKNNYINDNNTRSVKPTVDSNIRNAKRNNRNNNSRTTKNVTEISALAAESAIMTISNANEKYLKKPVLKLRKHLSDSNIRNQMDFAHTTTGVPQLPIEVYFTKLSKSK